VEDLPPGAADSGASAYVNKERFGADTLCQLWANRDSGSFTAAQAAVPSRLPSPLVCRRQRQNSVSRSARARPWS